MESECEVSFTASLANKHPQRQRSRAAVGLLPFRSISRHIVCKSGELKLCAFCVEYIIFSWWIAMEQVFIVPSCCSVQSCKQPCQVSFPKGSHQPFEPLVDLSEIHRFCSTWVLKLLTFSPQFSMIGNKHHH